MNAIKKRRLISSVSSLALLSVFFVGGLSMVRPASAAFQERFEEVMETEGRRRGHIHGQANARAQAEWDQLREERDDLDVTLQETRKISERDQKRLAAEENKVSKLTERVSELEADLDFAEKNKISLESQMVELRKRIVKSESDIRIATKANQSLTGKLTETKKGLQALRDELSLLETQKNEADQRAVSLQEDLDREKEARQKAVEQAALLEVQKEALQRKILKVEGKLTETDSRLKALEGDLVDLQSKERATRQNLFAFASSFEVPLPDHFWVDEVLAGDRLDTLFSTMSDDFTSRFSMAQRRIDELEIAKQKMSAESQRQKEEIEKKEEEFKVNSRIKDEEIKALNLSIHVLENAIVEIEKERDELKSQLRNSQQSLEETQEKNHRLELRIKALEEEKGRAAARMQDLERQVALLHEEKAQIEVSRKAVADLLALAQEAAAQDKDSLERTIRQLETELQTLRQQSTRDQAELEVAHRQALEKLQAEYRQSLGALSQTIEEKEQQVRESKRLLDEMSHRSQETKAQHESRLKEAQTDLKRARDDIAELGRQHGAHEQGLQQEYQSRLLEKEALVQRLQQEMDALVERMTQEQQRHVDQILETEKSLTEVRQQVKGEKAQLIQAHEEKVRELEESKTEAVRLFNETLIKVQEELSLAQYLVDETRTAAEQSTQDFQLQMKRLRDALTQEQERHEAEHITLQQSHQGLLAERENQHQRVLAEFQDQLASYLDQIEEKNRVLANNQEILEKNAQIIQDLAKDLEQEVDGVAGMKRIIDELMESGVDYVEQTEALTQKMKHLEKIKEENQELSLLQEALRGEISVLQRRQLESKATHQQQRENYEAEQRSLQAQLGRSLKENQALVQELRDAQKILEGIKSGQQRMEEILDDESVSTEEEGDAPFTSTTNAMIKLVLSLKGAEETLQAKVSETEDQVFSLEKQKSQQAVVVQRLEEKYREKEGELHEVQQALVAQQSIVSSLNIEVRTLETTIREKEKEQTQLQEDLLKKEERIDVLKESVQRLGGNKESLEGQIRDLEIQLQAETNKVLRFKEQVENLHTTLDQSTQRVVEQEFDVEEMEQLLQRKHEEIQGERREYEAMQKRSELEKDDILEKLAQVRGQLDAAYREMDNTRASAVRAIDAEHEAAEERIKTFEALISSFTDSLVDKEEMVSAKASEIQKLEMKLESAKKQLLEAKDENARLKTQQLALEQQSAKIKAQISVLEEELQEKAHETKTLSDLLATAQQQQRLVERTGKALSQEDRLLKELEEARRTLREAESKNTALEQMLRSLEDQSVPADYKKDAQLVEPVTPVKGRHRDAFTTPVKQMISTPTHRTQGADLARSQTPFAKNLARALNGLGPIGVHNQTEVLMLVLEQLKQAGQSIQLDAENPFANQVGRTPRSAKKRPLAQVNGALKAESPRPLFVE